MTHWLTPTILKGQKVDLIPLDLSHKEALLKAASDGNLSELWYTSVPTNESIDAYLDFAFEEQKKGWCFEESQNRQRWLYERHCSFFYHRI
ncbi:MAG: hypothetical protein ACPGVB_03050 [Chitinophagales bacterium]